jgi:hypothetical protein
MKFVKSCKGMTIVELLAAIVLLNIVMVLGLGFFSYVSDTYVAGTEYAVMQNDTVRVVDLMSKELQYAETIEMGEEGSLEFSEFQDDIKDGFESNYSYIAYQAEENKIIIYSNTGDIIYETNANIAGVLFKIEKEMIFHVSKSMLAFIITSSKDDTNIEIESKLQLLNVTDLEYKDNNMESGYYNLKSNFIIRYQKPSF